MKDLKQCRQEIDEIDEQMMALFERRMKVAKDVVTYKMAHHMEISKVNVKLRSFKTMFHVSSQKIFILMQNCF